MKVTANYKNEDLNFSSYSGFYKWTVINGLFASKTNRNGLSQNCSKIIFTQKDDSKITLRKSENLTFK